MKLNLNSEQIDELYNTYLKQRQSSKKNIERLGGTARDIDISSKRDFLVDLKSARSDDRKASYKSLAKKLARDEVYESTRSKAVAAAKAHAHIFGVEYSPGLVQAYRANVKYQGESIWENISKTYHDLRDQGLSSREVKNIITEEFFHNDFFGGSPK